MGREGIRALHAVDKEASGNILHKNRENETGPCLALLISPGPDPIWHPAPTHKVHKYYCPSAGILPPEAASAKHEP